MSILLAAAKFMYSKVGFVYERGIEGSSDVALFSRHPLFLCIDYHFADFQFEEECLNDFTKRNSHNKHFIGLDKDQRKKK